MKQLALGSRHLVLFGTLLALTFTAGTNCFTIPENVEENLLTDTDSNSLNSDSDSAGGDEESQVDIPGEPFNPSEFQEAKKTNFIPNPHGSRVYENERLFQRTFLLRNGLVAENKRWPKVNDLAVIPYLISSKFSSSDRLKIVKAFDNFHENTCIRFVPRTNQRDYVNILSGAGCDSDAGRMGGEQTLSLGKDCVYTDIAIHELNHAVGFWHEQNRPDRDNYISVYIQNVIPENRFNFDKMTPNQVNAFGQKYDTGSIMHYDKYAFSKDYGNLVVMEPKNGDDNMGLATVLSKTDIAKINQMYRCGGKKSQKNPKNPKKTSWTFFNRTRTEKFNEERKHDRECADMHDGCESFVTRSRSTEEDHCETNPWVKVNCRKSCDSCGSTCLDNNEMCPVWAIDGECQDHTDYMQIYCPKSCLMC